MKFNIYKDAKTDMLYAKRLLFFGLIRWTVFERKVVWNMSKKFTYPSRIESKLMLGLYTKLRKHYGIVRKDKFVETMTIT